MIQGREKEEKITSLSVLIIRFLLGAIAGLLIAVFALFRESEMPPPSYIYYIPPLLAIGGGLYYALPENKKEYSFPFILAAFLLLFGGLVWRAYTL